MQAKSRFKLRRLSVFLLTFVLGIFLGAAAIAQTTGKISGIITDAESGEPLPGVNVIVQGTELGAASDSEGRYSILNISPGDYSVTASMIGYQNITKTGVLVSVGHTTPLDFSLNTEAIAGEAVTVEAEREVVRMDESSSTISVTSEEMDQVASVTNLNEFINTQAGVEGMRVRGGGADQTQFMVDGLSVVDNRVNEPVIMVNLSQVAEMNIIKGGFNAEYGNVRSGLINVVTKDADPNAYHGSIDFRISPPTQKHGSYPVTDWRSFFLRPYLDPAVAMDGTDNWPEEIQSQYGSFKGWNAYAEDLLDDEKPINDLTAEQARDLFIWRHAIDGVDTIQATGPGGEPVSHPRGKLKYAHKPDWMADGSVGGPVPLVGKYLGNMTFFASHRSDYEMYALPTNKDYYVQENSSIKLTSRLTDNIKFGLDFMYREEDAVMGSGNGRVVDADDVFNVLRFGWHNDLYLPQSLDPMNKYYRMQGIRFDHVLGSNTFYNFRLSRVHINAVHRGISWRDTTTVGYIGPTPVNEEPYGYTPYIPPQGIGMLHPAHAAHSDRDLSDVQTINAKFDLTSQLNSYHQIKTGFTFNYDDIDAHYDSYLPGSPHHNYTQNWAAQPYRLGAYLQDKIEFEGLIANIGVRLDWNNPNTEWFPFSEPYSIYFLPQYEDNFLEVAPKEKAGGHMKLSPRIGISHPITEFAKLYFNYGHFYSMPRTETMFEIDQGVPTETGGISFLGKPSANLPQTVAYELGVDFDVANMFLVHLAGYYKDVTDQPGTVYYTDVTGLIDYGTTENNNYEDIRGFELRIDKRFGRFLTGWLNYDYRVSTSGYVGFEHYYQDEIQQKRFGLQNPYQERPLARPIARASLIARTPQDWGPRMAGMRMLADWQLSFLFYYRAGEYETIDPLQTFELENNAQWKPIYNVDAKLSKRVHLKGMNFTLFADVRNLLNIKYLDDDAFIDSNDWRNYYESLHLPMYEGERYQAYGLTPGNDKLGDVRSEDKPYIDMPNIDFLRYQNPRMVYFGVRMDF